MAESGYLREGRGPNGERLSLHSNPGRTVPRPQSFSSTASACQGLLSENEQGSDDEHREHPALHAGARGKHVARQSDAAMARCKLVLVQAGSGLPRWRGQSMNAMADSEPEEPGHLL